MSASVVAPIRGCLPQRHGHGSLARSNYRRLSSPAPVRQAAVPEKQRHDLDQREVGLTEKMEMTVVVVASARVGRRGGECF